MTGEGKKDRNPVGCLLAVAFAMFLLLTPFTGEGAEQKTPEPPKAAAPAPPPVIAVEDVAKKAMEMGRLIRTMGTNLAPSPEIEKIREQLPGAARIIGRQLTRTRQILRESPTAEAFQAQQQIWQNLDRHAAGWLNVLTTRATEIQRALDHLAALQNTWKLTREAAQSSSAPAPLLQLIDATLTSLGEAEAPLRAQRTDILDLQAKVADEEARCGNMLGEIARTQRTEGIFARERPPIWNLELWALAGNTLPALGPEVAGAFWTDLRQYIGDPSRGFPLHAGIFVGFALLLFAARRQVGRWAKSGKGVESAEMVFERPFSAALIGALLIAAGPSTSPAPPMARNVCYVLVLFPMIRLVWPVVPPSMISSLYILGALFALDTIRQAFAGAPLIGQAILVLETLAGIGVLARFLRRGNLRREPGEEGGTSRRSVLEAVAVLLILFLSVGLAASALGYLPLSRFIAPGILAGAVQALAIFALLQVAKGVVAFFLRVWPLRLLQMVQHHRSSVERRLYRWMAWLAALSWVGRYLDYIGLLDPVLSAVAAVLAVKLERGSINISVEDVLAFLLTVWVAYLLSAFIRFVLQEDVYPRIGVPRGLSYATSSLLHYILLALGVVVGLGVLGVNMTQITVLAGAFGVGIGFGLQSVINNFFSGLILLFERPVHVDDTVGVGDILGKIRRIGIRASVVHTSQGADIIVPNSQLISDKVTNWTLSDQLRRIDLPVGVNYGAAPQEVIKMLEGVAAAHPRVLKDPPSRAFFVGYGDSSINFELRAWTDQFDTWYQTRSDLAVGVYEAARAAGMSFPFPQREVRLLSDSNAQSPSGPKPAEYNKEEKTR